MEYLKSFEDTSKLYDESLFDFVDVTNDNKFIYGNLKGFNDNCCSGKRLRFSTSSKRILLKIELDRFSGLNVLPDWNAKGFDVYEVSSDKYVHKTVFAPFAENNIFSEIINNTPNSNMTIFLPNFSNIKKIYLGIEKNQTLNKFQYPSENKYPLIFIGDTAIQGAIATRSGNSFPNIISRITNKDIINIILNENINDFYKHLEKLENKCFAYYIIHISKRLIQNNDIEEIKNFYEKIIEIKSIQKMILLIDNNSAETKVNNLCNLLHNNEKTVVLYLDHLLDEEDLNLLISDENYFSDYMMYTIANKISEFVK